MIRKHSVSKISSSSRIGLSLICASITVAGLQARDFDVEIVAEGLNRPMGIVAKYNDRVYFTEVPDPGVPGSAGGENTVKLLRFDGDSSNIQSITTISEGEPYPLNLASATSGDKIYWTCQTAGVILSYSNREGKRFFLPADGLAAPEEDFLLKPTGITVDRFGDVLFTELPMPGAVGTNMVSVSDGEYISLISDDEPAPTDITISYDGVSYWTCSTAGVILKRSRAGVISLLLSGLDSPQGIAVNRRGSRLYFTEVPTPGVGGADGGRNMVKELDLKTMEVSVVADGFPWPADVTVSSRGNIYWTCTEVGVIAKATEVGN